MRSLPCERPKLHNCNKSAQVVNLLVLIFSMYHSRKVEQFRTLNIKKKKEVKMKVNYMCINTIRSRVIRSQCLGVFKAGCFLQGLSCEGLTKANSSQLHTSIYGEGTEVPKQRKDFVTNGPQQYEEVLVLAGPAPELAETSEALHQTRPVEDTR